MSSTDRVWRYLTTERTAYVLEFDDEANSKQVPVPLRYSADPQLSYVMLAICELGECSVAELAAFTGMTAGTLGRVLTKVRDRHGEIVTARKRRTGRASAWVYQIAGAS